ncbi:TonB-dependent siderophore receptor [Pseudomonas sp. BN414]|uniref:TonB-dependent receptor n=1 Tax=Pseudomonas sp. BN414 TaxID=2567888 RepID=UPI002454EFB3|nr:TonB-dependent siderophore receptor [Pseudomonas sp. BN414]MDH4567718.1 TonB-dependent siderophore receptor [Pseudomonas sp. BN414]
MSTYTSTGAPQPSANLSSSAVGLALASCATVSLAAENRQDEQPPAAPSAIELGSTDVRSTHVEGYKVDQASSPKFTAPLRDTPKSVTVITEDLIKERGASSLKDVLRTTPGITLGAGEGGTPVGDRPFIRGYEASTDIMIDGVRDVGRNAHEAFNLERVEIIKGPGSAYTGRGATGGSINLVSKVAQTEDFTAGSLTLGTDQLWRTTLDVNRFVAEQGMAFRLNAMKHEADTPGREDVDVKRWGIAPTVTFGLHTPTRATFSYYHLETDDMSDLGHPVSNITGKPVKVDRDNFYGLVDRDFSKTSADIASIVLEHDFSEALSLRNTTRGGRTLLDYVMTRPSFGNTNTPAQLNAAINRELNGEVIRDGRARNSVTKTLVNQTDIFGEFFTGGLQHSYSAGLEFSRETIDQKDRYSVRAGSNADLESPNPHDPFPPVTRGTGSVSETKQDVRAAYVFDTLKLHEQWDLNLGLRYDDYYVTNGSASNSSELLNYQVGLVFKPLPNGSIYLTYATSSNPAGETVGQAGGADGAAGGAAVNNLDPEKNRSLELGTKWDVLNEQLSLTAALFRIEKTDGRSQDPVTGDVTLSGDSRVDGFELGATGRISDAWQIWAGYTYLDPTTRKYRSGGVDYAGNQMKFIAPESFSLWTTYALDDKWTIGGGANYMDERYLDDANTRKLESYWRYDAMLGYKVNRNLDLQLNILNLADETIYDASHVGVFANVAPGRSAELTANFRF